MRYSLWIQDSDDVNATPTPGHTVAVTRWALYTLPPAHLEAVLAHELSHHLGGRAWLSLLSFWVLDSCSLCADRRSSVGPADAASRRRMCRSLASCCLPIPASSSPSSRSVTVTCRPCCSSPRLSRRQFSRGSTAAGHACRSRAALMGYGATLIQVLYGWQIQHQQMLGREVTSRRSQLMSSTPSLVERVQTLERANPGTLPGDPS